MDLLFSKETILGANVNIGASWEEGSRLLLIKYVFQTDVPSPNFLFLS